MKSAILAVVLVTFVNLAKGDGQISNTNAQDSSASGQGTAIERLSAEDTVAYINSQLPTILNYPAQQLGLSLPAHSISGQIMFYRSGVIGETWATSLYGPEAASANVSDLDFDSASIKLQPHDVVIDVPLKVNDHLRQDHSPLMFFLADEETAQRVVVALRHLNALIGSENSPQTAEHSSLGTLPDITVMLQRAAREKIVFSRQELQRLGISTKSLKNANGDRYTGTGLDGAAQNSSVVGSMAERVLGNRDTRVELAYQRACALPYDESINHNFCADLGDFYKRRGSLQMALAVYTLAPKCKSDYVINYQANGGPRCLEGAGDVYFDLGDSKNALLSFSAICSDYGMPFACSMVTRLGGQVDKAAANARFEGNREAAREERQRATYSADEKARESDARFDAVMGALQSMPGANDPNAVLNAGNQQAAAIRAIGDAHAARQQENSANSSATQTASSGAYGTTNGSARGSQSNSGASASSASASPGSQPQTGSSSQGATSSTRTSETCPNMRGYPDAGASCNPVRSESTCARILSASWSPATATGDGMLRVTFQNICGSTVRITAWGPAGGSNAGETTNVAPGGEYVFANDRQQYEYQADDGIDCSGNIMRPGCKTNPR